MDTQADGAPGEAGVTLQEKEKAGLSFKSLQAQATAAASNLMNTAKEKGAAALQAASTLGKRASGPVPVEEAPAPEGTDAPSAEQRSTTATSVGSTAAAVSTTATAAANTILEAAAGITRRTRDTSTAAYQAGKTAYHDAVQSLRRLTAPTRQVSAVCKADLRTKPCPQILLLCCNLIATQGINHPGIFQDTPTIPAADVEQLAAKLEDRMLLLPAQVEPPQAAAVVKHFLSSLEEPLLTTKLAERWVAAGKALAAEGDATAVPSILGDLPTVNWSTLRLLLETCYRIACKSNINGMNALALATALVPVLLWYHQPGSASMVNQASQMAAATLQALRSKLVLSSNGAPKSEGAPGTPGTETPPLGGAPAPGPAADKKPAVVLDDQELDVSSASFLEHTVVQQADIADKHAAAGVVAAPAASKVPLQGESLEAVIVVVEHLLLNFDELFGDA